MPVGLRVVRGRDWDLGDVDGGEGHVGTLVTINGDKTVVVQWDMGNELTCKAGKDGKHDLYVLDNAPIGVRHNIVICDNCRQKIIGARWKCGVCSDVDFCSPCYFADSHSLTHRFVRVDTEKSKRVWVRQRAGSTKIRAKGIYQRAKVKRGRDWEFADQDGGVGKFGVVEDVLSYGSDSSDRNAVRVKWQAGLRKVYRVGSGGKVDLTCVESAPGTFYYKEHLEVLDVSASTPTTCLDNLLKVGDKVCIHLSDSALRDIQTNHGGWSSRLSECIGQIATVKVFTPEGDAEIDCDGGTFRVFPGALMKVPTFKVGDTVKILRDEDKVKILQRNHGGWEEDTKPALGKVGKVVKIDSDGDVAVAFGQQAWVFNPACCTLAPGEEPVDLGEPGNRDEEAPLTDSEMREKLALFAAQLKVLELLGTMVSGAEEFVSAAANGQLDVVRRMVRQRPEVLNMKARGITALILASHEGKVDIVNNLLDAGADKEIKDLKGNTALLAAMMGKQEEIAVLLIRKGAQVDAINHNGRSTVHVAAYEGLSNVLNMLLEKKCDPNIKDKLGDTPLHDAINRRQDVCLSIILNNKNADLSIVNSKGMNAVQLATLRGNGTALDKLLTKAPQLAHEASADGYTPLHVAVINNHVNEANTLLIKAKVNVNTRCSRGLAAIHMAAHEGYFDMVKLLLEFEGEVSPKDNDGHTPLHACLIDRKPEGGMIEMFGLRGSNQDQDRVKIACFLIQHGARLDEKDKSGKTPMELCSNEHIRNGVQMFVDKKVPRLPGAQGRDRPSTADVFRQMFYESPIPCTLCADRIAEVRFHPCRHKVVCKQCCVICRRCPTCGKDIQDRFDKDGNRIIVVDACSIQ